MAEEVKVQIEVEHMGQPAWVALAEGCLGQHFDFTRDRRKASSMSQQQAKMLLKRIGVVYCPEIVEVK